jgi:hypothetical protein
MSNSNNSAIHEEIADASLAMKRGLVELSILNFPFHCFVKEPMAVNK